MKFNKDDLEALAKMNIVVKREGNINTTGVVTTGALSAVGGIASGAAVTVAASTAASETLLATLAT